MYNSHQYTSRMPGVADATTAAETRTAGDDCQLSRWFLSMMTIVALLLGGTTAFAQNPDDTCRVDRLSISTGYNHATSSLHATGTTTPYWRVVVDAQSGTVPRDANVISKISAWGGPLAGSQWIVSTPTWSNGTNGIYTYEYRFCLEEGFQKPELILDLLADDSARVFLNGFLVGSTYGSSPAFSVTSSMSDNNPVHFNVGVNIIRVEVANTHSVASGVNVAGYVQTSNGTILRPECCRPQPVEDCFELTEERIECAPLPGTNIMGYKYSFAIRSLFNCNNAPQTANVTVVAPAGVSVSPSSFPVSGSWSTQSLYFSGPGAVAGANVVLLVKVCCEFSDGTVRCCEERVVITLPDCDPTHDGCLTLLKDTIECIQTPVGPGFQWCFSVQNNSSFAARYLTLSPAGSFTISPNTVTFSPDLAPSAVSSNYCFTITGPAAIPGATLKVYFRFCDSTKQRCCIDSAYIRLPECEPVITDCCDHFTKRFAKLADKLNNLGNGNFSGAMWAAGPGSTPIKSVTATLVSVSIDGNPSWGYITSGFIAGFGAGTLPAYPYPHDISWGPTGPVAVAGNAFNVGIKVPPLAKFKDVVRYCVRFTYTDANCITCDTVICFTRTRKKFIIIDHFPWEHLIRGGETEKGGSRVQGAGEPGISGVLMNGTSRMNITLPDVPSEYGTITYTGLEIESGENDVAINNAVATGYVPLVSNGVASIDLNAPALTSIDFDLAYDVLDDRASLLHRVRFSFVLSGDKLDTLEEEVLVTMRRDGLTGGDRLAAEEVKLDDVRTYALHLDNQNGTEESISRLLLQVPDGVEILAVGPSAYQSSAMLQLGSSGEQDFSAAEIIDGQASLEYGASHGPIYVTIAGNGDENVELDFATINEYGQTITEGQVVLSKITSSIQGGTVRSSEASILEQSFPNPAVNSATIRFQLPSSATNVTLVVTDQTGREVARPVDGESLSAGEHVVHLSTAALTSGTYYYSLRAGSAVETRAMQVVH